MTSRRQGVFERLSSGASSRVPVPVGSSSSSSSTLHTRTASLPTSTQLHHPHYSNNTIVTTSSSHHRNNNNNSNHPYYYPSSSGSRVSSATGASKAQRLQQMQANNVMNQGGRAGNNNTILSTSPTSGNNIIPASMLRNQSQQRNTNNNIRTSSNSTRPPSGTNNNNNNTLPFSHTIGRIQDRNKLGLIEKDNYGHSPLNHQIDYSVSSPVASPKAGAGGASSPTTQHNNNKIGSDTPSSPVSGFQQRTPSRGLFSPSQQQQQQQQGQNQNDTSTGTGGGGGGGSSSSANTSTSFTLPGHHSTTTNTLSPSVTSNRASPLHNQNNSNNNNNNTREGSLPSSPSVYTSPFHPVNPHQYRPTHPAHQRSHLLPKLESLHKQMLHHSKYNNKNTNSSLGFRSPSMEDLTSELVSKNNASSSQGATAGAFGQSLAQHQNQNNNNFVLGAENVFHHTIVFDLDETLCSNRGPTKAIIRPGAVELLRELAAARNQLKKEHELALQHQQDHYEGSPTTTTTKSSSSSPPTGQQQQQINPNIRSLEIVLWTASMEDVAEPVIVRLDPYGDVFDHLIFRDNRWFRNEANYTKDLRLLGRDFGGIVIVENSPVSVRLNRQNSILVKDFVGHSYRDNDLFAVKDILMSWIHGNEKCFTPIDKHLKNHSMICPRTNNVRNVGGGVGAVTRW